MDAARYDWPAQFAINVFVQKNITVDLLYDKISQTERTNVAYMMSNTRYLKQGRFWRADGNRKKDKTNSGAWIKEVSF